jgi:photosystem II stability/assembly factor-like uncharacterized protein
MTRSIIYFLFVVACLSMLGSCGKDDSISNPPTDTAPTCNITSPADSTTFVEGQTINFSATATDPEDGSLTGGSLVWTSDQDGQIGTGNSFGKNDLSVNKHLIELKVTDSDGRADTDSLTVFVSTNNYPTATIISPADGSSFSPGQAITFTGEGTDPEDGQLPGGSLVWESDKDGQIGMGTSFNVSNLSVNSHEISLTVTDIGGLSNTDRINIGISSWDIQNSGTSNHLMAVCFTHADTGTVVGDGGTILRTTDGGTTWTPQISGTINSLEDVFFADANTGTVVGGGGTILHTDDGGTTWVPQTSGTSEDLSGVHFYVNPDIFPGLSWGNAVGSNGIILRTTDEGATWTPQTSGVGTWLLDVHLDKPLSIRAVGVLGIIGTIDGGTTWTPEDHDLTGIPTLSGVYIDSDNFVDVIVGTSWGEGVVLKLSPGMWTKQNIGTVPPLYDVSFSPTDPLYGMAVGGEGTVLSTATRGTTWNVLTSGVPNSLNGVWMVEWNIATAVGNDGIILRTTTGGQ